MDMPSWQPNWEDVRFDYAGAEEAAQECDECAQFISGRHAVLGPPLAEARARRSKLPALVPNQPLPRDASVGQKTITLPAPSMTTHSTHCNTSSATQPIFLSA